MKDVSSNSFCIWFWKLRWVKIVWVLETVWHTFTILAITFYSNVRFKRSWYRWKQDSKTHILYNYDEFWFWTDQYQFSFLYGCSNNEKQIQNSMTPVQYFGHNFWLECRILEFLVALETRLEDLRLFQLW